LFIAAQPPDRSHPQGHSRFEPLVGLVVTAAMTIAAYEAGRNAVETFIEGAKAIPISLPSLVVLASAAVKVVMYLFIKNIARQQDSPSLRAIAVDNLTDILTSIVVFLGTIASTFLAPIFDPIAGIVVGLWIITAAIRSGRENLVFLTGGSANAEIRDQIIKTAASVKGIKNIHHLITEYVGPHLIVDMHCAIDPALPFTRAHEICDEITQLIESMPEVDRAYVHMEPVESGGTERS
jgi:cation diffusion facilitator family transporter